MVVGGGGGGGDGGCGGVCNNDPMIVRRIKIVKRSRSNIN